MKSLTFTKIWLISICQDKIFGVVGSGDTFYDYFCKSVDEFETQIHLLLVQQKVRIVSKLTFLLKMKISKNLEAFAEKVSEALA